MLIPLFFPVLLASSAAKVPAMNEPDPPVHVWLNSDGTFERGDHARVFVQTADDGYVVVLRADDNGRVRVLYPVDPTDDGFVRATDKFEIKGRDDRDAFLVDDRSGGGLVMAAYSQDPFSFDAFARNGHWNLSALSVESTHDPEALLMDRIQTMAGSNPFDYDFQKYVTSAATRRRMYRIGAGYWDPWFYDPWCFACGPYGFGFGGSVYLEPSFGHFVPRGHAFHDERGGRADRDHD